MLLGRLLASLFIFTLSLNVQASKPESFAACVSCHGEQGQGTPALSAPVIAGLDAKYIARQLQLFKAGIRGGEQSTAASKQMAAVAQASINDQQIDELADYVAGLPLPNSTEKVMGKADAGQKIYVGNCGACHGSSGQGNPSLHAPRLVNQNQAYLQQQIVAFQQGQRGSHPDDKYGRQMAMMAKSINNAEAINNVLSFLAQLEQEQ